MTWQDSPWVEQIYVKKERQLTADFLEVDLCSLCAFLSFLFRPFVNEIIHIVNTRSMNVRAGSSRTMRQKKNRVVIHSTSMDVIRHGVMIKYVCGYWN